MATPTLVQHASTSAFTIAASSPFTTSFELPNVSLAGNCIIVAFGWAAVSPAVTISSVVDDKSQTYTNGITKAGTLNFGSLALYYFPNTAAGAKKITVTFSAAQSFVAGVASEWQNISTSPSDGAGSTSSTESTVGTTSWAAGSLTPTSGSVANPDLIYQFAVGNGAGAGTNADSFTAGSGFTLASVDRFTADTQPVAQWETVTASTAVNPTITDSASAGYVSVAMAFKSAAQGTAPTITPRVVRLQYQADTGNGTSFTLQFPCSGNLLVVKETPIPVGATGAFISAITDSNSNTWTQVTGSPLHNGTGGTVGMWYAKNATTSSAMTITLTLHAAATQSVYCFEDVTGAATNPFDTSNTATGNQASGTQLNTVSLTPGSANEYITCIAEDDAGVYIASVADGNSHTAAFDAPLFSGQVSGTANWTNDAGYAHINPTDVTQVTFVWTMNVAPGLWAAIAAAFKAPGSGSVVTSTDAPALSDVPSWSTPQFAIAVNLTASE